MYVKVVGGPCVFKVMNGCSKNHCKNLQLAEPMLHIHIHTHMHTQLKSQLFGLTVHRGHVQFDRHLCCVIDVSVTMNYHQSSVQHQEVGSLSDVSSVNKVVVGVLVFAVSIL